MRCHSAVSISSVGARRVIAGAAEDDVGRAERRIDRVTQRAPATLRRRHRRRTGRVRRPRPSISRATSSTRFSRRAVATTSAPASASPSASTRPMPLVPPMTTAVLPLRSKRDGPFLGPPRGAPRAPRSAAARGLLLRLVARGLQQVLVHRPAGSFRVTRADRLVDVAVRFGGVTQIAVATRARPFRAGARNRGRTPSRRATPTMAFLAAPPRRRDGN